MKINDNISILHNGERYTYTIVDYELGSIGIIEVCNILNKKIRECLDISEDKKAHISSYNGQLYFKEKETAEEFIKYLKDVGYKYS